MTQRGWTVEDWILALVVAVTLACVAMAASGCGAAALRAQAETAQAVGAVLHEAKEVGNLQVRGGMVACGESERTAPAFEACADRVEAKWAPLIDALALVAIAHNAWLDALLAAYLADRDGLDASTLIGIAAAIFESYTRAVEAAQALGIDLPRLPEVGL